MSILGLSSYIPSWVAQKPSANGPLIDPTYLKNTYPFAYASLTGKALPLFNESSTSPSDLAILNFLRAIDRNGDRVNESFDEVLEQFKDNPEKCRQILAAAQKLAPNLSEFCEDALNEVNELRPAAPKNWLKMIGVGILIAAIATPVILSGTQKQEYCKPDFLLDKKFMQQDVYEGPLATEQTALRMFAPSYEYPISEEYAISG